MSKSSWWSRVFRFIGLVVKWYCIVCVIIIVLALVLNRLFKGFVLITWMVEGLVRAF